MGRAKTAVLCPTTGTGLGHSAISPGHVHRGDIELDPFEPQHHEEPLAEGTVSNVFSIHTSLPGKQRNKDLSISWVTQPSWNSPTWKATRASEGTQRAWTDTPASMLLPAPGVQLEDPTSEPC